MKLDFTRLTLAVTALTFCAPLTHSLIAQDDPPAEEEDVSVEALYLKAGGMMQDGNFQGAIEVFKKMFDLAKKEFLFQDYGPAAGGFYFDYGVAQMQSGDFEGAAESFETCHNGDKLAEEYKSAVSRANPKKNLALFQWGYCEQQLGHPQKAVELYDQFLASGDESVAKSRNIFKLRKGTALVQAGQQAEGEALINELLDNRVEWGVNPAFLMQAVYDIGMNTVDSVNRGADAKEATEGAMAFLDKVGNAVETAPFTKFQLGFMDRMLGLGLESNKAGLHALAIRYFSFIPTYDEVVTDIKQRSLPYGENIPGPYMEQINKVNALQAAEIPQEVKIKQLTATAWEGLGSYSAARSIYATLTDQFPDIEKGKRAEILHEAARLSSQQADYNSAQYFGEKFMAEMPEDHPLRDAVSTYMLQSLFTSQQFDEVIRIGQDVQEKYPEGDSKRELADALIGMAWYVKQDPEKAAEAFDLHIKSFKESQNREMILYHRANNQLFLGNFRKSADLMQEFLGEFPESARYLATALSDLALARFNFEDYSGALEAINSLIEKRPDSKMADRALALKGDSLLAMSGASTDDAAIAKYDEDARSAFLQAAEKGQALEASDDNPEAHRQIVGEALAKATDLFVDAEQYEEAVKYYDQFMAGYTGTDYEAQISVFTLPALIEQGRAEDGLVQIEKMINQMGNKPPEEQDTTLLRQAIGSYSDASKDARGVEATLASFDSFPGLDPDNQALLTWLKIQKVIVLQEERGAVQKDSAEYAQYEGEIAKVFEELKTYDMSTLSEIALQQIGLYIKSTDNPFLAIPYFEELLVRSNPDADQFKGAAELAIAEIEMRRSDKASLDSARDRLIRIVKQYQDDELMPEAILNLGRIYLKTEEWADAKEQFARLNKEKEWFRKEREIRAESNFSYGLATEKTGDTAGAIKVYHSVWTVYGGFPNWATQSVERIVELGREDVKTIQNTAEEPTKQRDKQIEYYAFLKQRLYEWQNFTEEQAPDGALGRLRRQIEVMRAEYGITPEEEQQINIEMGLNPDGTSPV